MPKPISQLRSQTKKIPLLPPLLQIITLLNFVVSSLRSGVKGFSVRGNFVSSPSFSVSFRKPGTDQPKARRRMTSKAAVMENTSSMDKDSLRFVDIGANLLDERFTNGIYFGKQRHEPDMDQILERAQEAGVTHIILTAGTLRESRRALDLVRELRQKNETMFFGCTVGVHPTRCSQEFLKNGDQLSATDVLEALKALALEGLSDKSVVAIGEIGLDYDRLEFCDKETQQKYFEEQLQTMCSEESLKDLPLFLHNRNVGSDLLQVLKKDNRQQQGVVHSFDDSLELAQQFIDLGLYIGLNGCSLKTSKNLAVVKELPLDKILLETDCPYCEIKNTHAGSRYVATQWEKKADKKFELGKMVKGRNEPCQIVQVAEVIARVKGISLKAVADACFENSLQLYGWNESM